MLKIGKSYIVRADGMSRLCADLTIVNRRTTLWFGVDSAQEDFLALGRADAFVMALLPTAMRGGHEIVCEDKMSERLHHQLVHGLIPALAFAVEAYHLIKITAPLTTERYPNQGAVCTGFSGGVDSLYTIMRHGADSEFPLTHIATFNTGNLELAYGKSVILKNNQETMRFAAEQNLQAVCVDTNFAAAIPERYNDVYSFRNLACALALQGLCSVYFLSSAYDTTTFELCLRHCCRYDLLTINCSSTESLSFYLSGVESRRWEKIQALTKWNVSQRWLHSCLSGIVGDRNCSRCKKCIRDLTVLYALGALEQYQSVFDIDSYRRHLPQYIGFILANRGHHLCDEILQLMETRSTPIPPASYIYEKQFRLAMGNLRNSRKEREAL